MCKKKEEAKWHTNIASQSSLLLINHPTLSNDLKDCEEVAPWEDLDIFPMIQISIEIFPMI